MKKALNTAHKWAGLFVGVLFLLQAITGLTMVYREPLTALLNADARVGTGTPAPLDALFAAIARAEPGGQLERITYPADHTIAATARIIMPDKAVHIALINPEKGSVISSGPLWRYPVELSNRVHTSLLMGTTGNVILALEGLTLAFMTITGLIVWWPRAGRFVYPHHYRKAPWRRLLRDLKRRRDHCSVSLISAQPHLDDATDGTMLSEAAPTCTQTNRPRAPDQCTASH